MTWHPGILLGPPVRVSVADELAYEALPLETRRLAEAYMRLHPVTPDGVTETIEERLDAAREDGYEEGFQAGQLEAEEESRDAQEALIAKETKIAEERGRQQGLGSALTAIKQALA